MNEFPVEITFKNYRCFSDESPVKLTIDRGFTAFVGPNNSGKSTALRFFHECRSLLSNMLSDTFIEAACRGRYQPAIASDVLDQSEIFCDSNEREASISLAWGKDVSDGGTWHPGSLTFYSDRVQGWRVSYRHEQRKPWFTQEIGWQERPRQLSDGHRVVNLRRAQSAIEKLVNSIYIGPFRNVINTGGANYYGLMVGAEFVRVWKQYTSGSVKKEALVAQKVRNDVERIFNIKRLELLADDASNTLQANIDGRPYKLHEHGAGLTQFIMVLANAAVKKPAFIFIDEPELSLHPSLQIDFLTTLHSYCSEGVVFATHSIGLARSTAKTIFSFARRDGDVTCRHFSATKSFAEFAGQMSFSSYADLGCDTLLLVEGVSDVLTMQQLLRKVGKDHKIAVLPLGGDGLIQPDVEQELSELKRLTSNIAVIFDSERTSHGGPPKKGREEFKASCEKLGFRVLMTERRATENYFSRSAIESVLGPLASYPDHYGEPSNWNKGNNWRIALAMDWKDLKDTDIGQFIEKL